MWIPNSHTPQVTLTNIHSQQIQISANGRWRTLCYTGSFVCLDVLDMSDGVVVVVDVVDRDHVDQVAGLRLVSIEQRRC